VFDCLAEDDFDATALLATAFFVGFPAAERSAARLRFNASIKLMTFSRDGGGVLIIVGNSACLLRSISTSTVR
jgi:hypothetical protein